MKRQEKQTDSQYLKDWDKIRSDYPAFAKVYLQQQLILIEAARLGSTSAKKRMCELLKHSSVVFQDFWLKYCVEVPRESPLQALLDCLKSSPDPGSCFESDRDWFHDPLEDWGKLPDPPPNPYVEPLGKLITLLETYLIESYNNPNR